MKRQHTTTPFNKAGQMNKRKMQKVNSLILLTILLSLATSCALTPPAVPLCVEINPFKGYCANTITSESFYIDDTNKYNGKSWFEIRPTMVQMPHESWVEIKSFIIKTCKKYNCAKYNISNWERTTNVIDDVVNSD